MLKAEKEKEGVLDVNPLILLYRLSAQPSRLKFVSLSACKTGNNPCKLNTKTIQSFMTNETNSSK